MSIETLAFGGNGGSSFDEQFVRSIGFSAGGLVDAIVLNGERFGGSGGSEGRVLEFGPDEYIKELTIMTGRARIKGRPRKRRSRSVFKISFKTNRGRTLEAGTGTAGKDRTSVTLSGIRVLAIGGSSGRRLDKLRIKYISDYVESELIEKGANAVLSVVPQGQKLETFVSNRVSRLAATERLLETTASFEQTSEAGAAFGEFSARASTTFGFTVTARVQLTERLETERVNTETRTYEPPAGHIGLEVVKVDVFRSEDDTGADDDDDTVEDGDEDEGTVWMFPVAEPNIVSVDVAQARSLTDDLYDLTGQLDLHLPPIASKKGERYGYEAFALSAPLSKVSTG